MDLARWTVFAFLIVYVAHHWRLLSVLTDWISFAVDEGYTSYAARRIREGEVPHRDFFFLWTPGTAYFHALLQWLGANWLMERAVPMLASAGSSLLVLRQARGLLGRADSFLLMLLLLCWGFALWNIPYSSWYAVFLALAATNTYRRFPVLGGVLFGLSFWFKQNVGILSFLGASAFLIWPLLVGKESVAVRYAARQAFLRLATGFAVVFVSPFIGLLVLGGKDALLQALSQIFLFPLRYPSLMGEVPAGKIFAAPLTSFGLWILSLFFLRQGHGNRTASLLQFGLVVYIGMQAVRAPREFIVGAFFLLSLVAWPLALVTEISRGSKQELQRLLSFLVPGFGIFLQVAPRLDFQHFLFVFPISALLLCRSLSILPERYTYLAGGWVRLPILLLAAGGIFLQAQVQKTLIVGKLDPLGVITYDLPYRLNEEAAAAIRFLRSEGLPDGGPLLVLPNATSFYQWSGFRNPTPHQQFFPGYVEAFGSSQRDVLQNYRARGGHYLLVQERSGLERDVPELAAQIEQDYEVLKMFPEYFTVYVPKAEVKGRSRGL